jgi:hypothetical protein
MKKMKIVLLALALGINLVRADSCSSFTDVSDSDAICSDVAFAKESGWVNGYKDGSFRPNKLVSRAEFTKVVMSAIYRQSFLNKNCFELEDKSGEYEVKSNEWYSGYVCTAKEKGIIKGKSDNLFHPEDNIQYVEALKIILKALGFSDNEIYTNWYTPYVNEANTMGLPIYENEHAMTRGETIKLLRQTYSKHTKRALAEKKWKEMCHAKNYHFYKLGRTETCEEKWAMQVFYEVGVPSLNAQSTQIRYSMESVQNTHDIALSTFKQIDMVMSLGGAMQNNLISFQLESIKTLSGVVFNEVGDDAANVTGGAFDIGLSIMQETIDHAFGNVVKANYASFAIKFAQIGTDVWGAYSLTQKTQILNNLNIAIAYLEDYYQYGRSNGLVAEKEAKINFNANMYDTIYYYAINKGYKNSWWSDEFDYSKILDIVEKVKENVTKATQDCYLDGQCLAQERKELENTYNVFTINGKKERIILKMEH